MRFIDVKIFNKNDDGSKGKLVHSFDVSETQFYNLKQKKPNLAVTDFCSSFKVDYSCLHNYIIEQDYI